MRDLLLFQYASPKLPILEKGSSRYTILGKIRRCLEMVAST
nr:hypothetical protein [Trichocoleus desertorum]